MNTKNSINDLFFKEKPKNANKKFTILFEDYSHMGVIFKSFWTKSLHKVFTSRFAMREARTQVMSSEW